MINQELVYVLVFYYPMPFAFSKNMVSGQFFRIFSFRGTVASSQENDKHAWYANFINVAV